jgi:hypothetical protein
MGHMLLRILFVAYFLASTVVMGFVYFRWDSLPRRERYGRGDKALAGFTFWFTVIATILITYIAITR